MPHHRARARPITRILATGLVGVLLAGVLALGQAVPGTVPALWAGEADAAVAADIRPFAADVPEAPAEVWSETFEQGLSTTAASGITGYAAGRYTASAGWANGANCTGVLVNWSATYPNTNFCPSELIIIGIGGSSTLGARETRRMADVLGQVAAGVAGTTSSTAPTSTGQTTATRTNHALTAAPYAAIAANNTVVLQSAAGIGVTAPAPRFYTMRVDALGDECANNPSSLTFSLLSGATTFSPFSAPIVPCTNAAATYYTSTPVLQASGGGLDGTVLGGAALTASVRAGTFTGTTPVLLTPAQIAAAQVTVTNTATTAIGNAFAIDNLRLLDVTPSLDIAFSATSVVAGTASTLTYTVTNTTDLLAKSDWSFSNALPAGLVVAPTPALGGTCAQVTGGAFAVTAAAGASTISAVGGDLAAAARSCTITVNVVSTTTGTYTNAPANFAAMPLVAPDAATLTVTPATTITVRKNIVSRAAAGDQFVLTLRGTAGVIATATTTGTATGVQPVQISPTIVSPGTTYTIQESTASGAGLNYASSYECVRAGTVIAAGSAPSGTITTPAEAGADIVCTFTNTPQTARLACDTSHFYSVSGAGALTQGDIVSGANVSVGSWTGAASANALGVGVGGSSAFALDRSTDGSDVASILKWTPTGGFQTLAASSYTTVAGSTTIEGTLVAGAIDLSGTKYYFGKFVSSQFYIWSYTESNPTATRFAFVGSFPTGTGPNGNGDMAFDASGNLYVVGAATVNNVSSAAIYTVTAATLATASGGTLAVSSSTTKALVGIDVTTPAFGSVNGIAFSPRGTAYLSSGNAAYEFDPTTWVRISGTPRVALTDATDMGGCTSPATLTLLKNVVGRAVAADQFQLTVANGSVTAATVSTTGSATGRQSQQIGPIPVPTNTVMTLSETMAPGSTSALGVYTTVYECWADGVLLSSGTTATGSVTMPSRLSVNVVCTYFNSPRAASNVTLTKQVVNPATGATSAAAGWTLGVAAAATIGTATVLPSEAPRQQTNAAGQAVWSVLFGSQADRATLTISEVQQTGFTLQSGTCTVNGVATAVAFTTSAGVVSGSIPNVQSASTIACTLVNRPTASLTLVKTVGFGTALPTDWILTATAPTGALPGPTGRSGSAQTSAIGVTPGVAYRLSESGGPLVYVQTGTWVCVTSGGQSVAVSAAGDITLGQGTAVTCTVTNATASITLLKQVESPQAGFQPQNWTVVATPATFAGGTLPTVSRPGAAYSAAGNAASTFEVRPGHGYTLSEKPAVDGTRLAYRTLRLERLDGATWTTVPSATITAPAAGQTAVYRFVNAPVQPTILPLTGGASTDAFQIAGGTLLAIAIMLALFHGWRSQRRRTA